MRHTNETTCGKIQKPLKIFEAFFCFSKRTTDGNILLSRKTAEISRKICEEFLAKMSFATSISKIRDHGRINANEIDFESFKVLNPNDSEDVVGSFL